MFTVTPSANTSAFPHAGSPVKVMNTKHLAQQLALIDSRLFMQISRTELLGLKWTRQDKKTLAPNVDALVQWWNQARAIYC